MVNTILEVDYLFEPYEYYSNRLSNEFTEFREMINLYEKGTKKVIGKLYIFTTLINKNQIIHGQVDHVYYLPDTKIYVKYITKNKMNSKGGFLPNETIVSPIISAYGKYLGLNGKVVLKTDDTQTRTVKIVLNT
jgi:hypothetical protein